METILDRTLIVEMLNNAKRKAFKDFRIQPTHVYTKQSVEMLLDYILDALLDKEA